MDVSTFNMHKKSRFSFFQYEVQTLKSTVARRLVGIAAASMVMLPSSRVHADDLADLIRQKSQTFYQPSPAYGTSSSFGSAPSFGSSPAFGQPGTASFYQSYASAPNISPEYIDTLYRAEQIASMPSQQVLRTVRQMALDNKEIIKGSCWDYLNAAFNRAGVRKETVFKGEYPAGPFIDTSQIQPGDWLYYVNHSYNDIEHSGLFVGWLNRDTNEALILSYAGERRNEPARYKVYDVSHTYNVMRPSL